jgi:hypothetical protein
MFDIPVRLNTETSFHSSGELYWCLTYQNKPDAYQNLRHESFDFCQFRKLEHREKTPAPCN